MMKISKKQINNFQDLIVYQNLYDAMLRVHKEIVINLPGEEKYDLADQLKRASKAAPSLIAEGFAKRYQKLQWNRYITDSIGECNEMIHHLSTCIDLYEKQLNRDECRDLISIYTITCKQLTMLGKSWNNYHNKKTK